MISVSSTSTPPTRPRWREKRRSTEDSSSTILRAQIVGNLMLEHEVVQKIESSAGLAVRSGGTRRDDRCEEVAIGQCIRPRELGTRSSVGVLLGRRHLRLPPREIRREREWSEPGLGLVEDRERVPHSGRDPTRAHRVSASPR